MKEIHGLLSEWDMAWRSVRGPLAGLARSKEGLNGFGVLLDFLTESRGIFNNLKKTTDRLLLVMDRDNRQLMQLTDQIQRDVHLARMLPASSIFEIFPRMVRDLARGSERLARLEIKGGGTEVDRRILETIKDPLTHLIRNAVDHGLEKPEERERVGKPRQGQISLSATQAGSTVVIAVQDDGRGLDKAALVEAAVTGGFITEDQAAQLDENQIIELMFQPNLSTKRQTTSISGRGVGLDVVRRGLEGINGVVTVESRPGRGTVFRMTLPLTVTTSRVLLIRVKDQKLAVPLASIQRIHRVDPEQVASAQGQPTIRLGGRSLPVFSLAETLTIADEGRQTVAESRVPVLVIAAVEKTAAFVVDELVGNREVVIKNMGSQLRLVPHLAGAAILGSGEVVMVINTVQLLNTAISSGRGFTVSRPKSATPVRQRLLVADDSLTTRVLVKNILETVGYQVTAVADGRQAWSVLSEGQVDAVVTDIDMPGLDGFALTEKIRGRQEYEDLPVILVTSMGSDEDKARGLEAGADAYIIKGSFDQTELLEAIDRLIGPNENQVQ